MSSLNLSRTALPSLSGGTIAITGGASGIGRATAELAAQAGANVLVGDMNDAGLAELAAFAQARRLGIDCMRLDVTEPDSVAKFVTTAAGAAVPLTGLVCSAGISPDVPTCDMTLGKSNHGLALNRTCAFRAVHLATQLMAEPRPGVPSSTHASAGHAT